jgi:hypothetical protein
VISRKDGSVGLKVVDRRSRVLWLDEVSAKNGIDSSVSQFVGLADGEIM